MLLLIIGLATFFAIHLLPTNRPLREVLVRRLGYWGYMAFFSILSLASFALIVIGYHKLQLHPGKNPLLWSAPEAARHLALGGVLLAAVLLVAAFIPSRIGKLVKQPASLALLIWATVHAIVNGDLGSLVMFGTFIAYALVSLRAARGRQKGSTGAGQPASMLNDLAVVLLGVALYYLFVRWGHPALIGVVVLPG